MKRTIPFLLTVALGVSILAMAATADEQPPEHPYVLVLGLEFDEETETRCRSKSASTWQRISGPL